MASTPRVEYRPDRRGLSGLFTSPEMAAAMRSAAEKGAAYAESIAPRDTGRYASSFRVEVITNGGPRSDRAEARVVNDAPYAWAVEWAGRRYRVLGRTVDYIAGNGP